MVGRLSIRSTVRLSESIVGAHWFGTQPPIKGWPGVRFPAISGAGRKSGYRPATTVGAKAAPGSPHAIANVENLIVLPKEWSGSIFRVARTNLKIPTQANIGLEWGTLQRRSYERPRRVRRARKRGD